MVALPPTSAKAAAVTATDESVRWPPAVSAPVPPELEWWGPPEDLEIVADDLAFPEGPIACADGSVLLVEVRGCTLTRVLPSGDKEVIARVDGAPNGAALGPDGAVYICNNGGLPWTQLPDGAWYPADPVTGSMTPQGFTGGWVERVDLSTGEVRTVITGSADRTLNAPSDIAFDHAGNMWFTDIGKSDAERTTFGAVYRATCDGSEVGLLARSLLGPNGIALSPDESRVYVADSPSGRVLEWDVSKGQLPANPRMHGASVRNRFPGSFTVDGLAVDAQDRIIVALPQAGALGVLQPDGGAWLIAMPDPLPTNACFGGKDGCTLFVTLGGHGRLARFRWPCPGAAIPFSG
jgi:gluconolactonase